MQKMSTSAAPAAAISKMNGFENKANANADVYKRQLRDYLAEELLSQEWQVQEDSNIERGGCFVETGANQIDATTQVRWKRISEALAQKNDWLLP